LYRLIIKVCLETQKSKLIGDPVVEFVNYHCLIFKLLNDQCLPSRPVTFKWRFNLSSHHVIDLLFRLELTMDQFNMINQLKITISIEIRNTQHWVYFFCQSLYLWKQNSSFVRINYGLEIYSFFNKNCINYDVVLLIGMCPMIKSWQKLNSYNF